MNPDRSTEDRGWGRPLRTMPRTFVPWLAFHKQPAGDGLDSLRVIYLSLVIAPAMLLVVLLFIFPAPGQAPEPWGPPALLLSAFGVVILIVLSVRRGKPLAGSTETELAAAYRGDLFVGVGLAESVILFSFVGVFITGAIQVYLVGLLLGYAGLLVIAPTRRNLARRQEQLGPQGYNLSLVRALRKPAQSASDALE